MPNQKKSSGWVQSLVNSGIIGLFISAALIIIQGQNDKYLQDLQGEHEEYLQTLQLAHEDSMMKFQQRFQIQLAEHQASLDVKNEIKLLSERFEKDIGLINQQLMADTLESKQQVEYNFKEELNTTKLDFVSKQLSEFYWPILYRLEKNNAVYHMLDNTFVGDKIDNEVVLPNHLAILQILEEKIHLAQPDSILKIEISKYLEHVNMYQMLRKGGYIGYPENYNGQGYDQGLFLKIRARTDFLQEEYEKLLELEKLSVKIPLDIYKDLLVTQNSKTELIDSTGHASFYFDVKLSHIKAKAFMYPVPIPEDSDSISIAFKNYVSDSQFAIFQIGFHDKVKANRGRNFHLKKGEPFSTNEFGHFNYQITLQEVWEERPRFLARKQTKASIKVERWRKLD